MQAAVAERVQVMSHQQVCQGRQAIREIVTNLQLTKISERVKQKNK